MTNQSGLARGYFNESLLNQIHENLLNEVKKENAIIEKIYYCPHHIDGIISHLQIECDCRKPKPGMLLKAQKEYNISLQDSYLIGDRYKDIQFGKSNGLNTIMVMTGYGLGEYTYQRNSWEVDPDYTSINLLEAAQIISENELQSNNWVWRLKIIKDKINGEDL